MKRWLPQKTSCALSIATKTGALINAAVQMGAAAAKECSTAAVRDTGILRIRAGSGVPDHRGRCWMLPALRSSWASPLAATAETVRPPCDPVTEWTGAMALAQELNEQICTDLQQHFGAKAAFPAAAGSSSFLCVTKTKEKGLQICSLFKTSCRSIEILTASLLSWFVAQVLKDHHQLYSAGQVPAESGCGAMAVCPVHTAQRSVLWPLLPDAARRFHSAIFAVACSGGNHHHARCYGRPARDRRAGKGAEPDDGPVDRCEREKRSLFAEYAPEGNGRPHAAAGRGRRAARLWWAFCFRSCKKAAETPQVKRHKGRVNMEFVVAG